MQGEPLLVLLVLAAEACAGYPAWLYRRIAHPVVWTGALIDLLERRWNRAQARAEIRRARGVLAIVLVAGSAAVAGFMIERLAGTLQHGAIVLIVVATTGLAQRSLCTHVSEVLNALRADDVAAARERLSRIVGRDTGALEPNGIAAAALESLAESFNDAVVAPAFWLLIGGLPGLFAYKAINTADSMIGHMEPRWREFGWASARLDDLANLAPARFAGVLLALAARRGFAVMWRDARKHASPNAGWPEAALAGGLSICLGGAASYDSVIHQRPVFGDGAAPAPGDLSRGLHIYMYACGLLWLALGLIGLLLARGP